MTNNYNIIACDGGGIRGLITAMLLDDLVKNPPKNSTNTNILGNVNLFAGTSTGAIIAIGLACNLQPSALVSLYSSKCGSIFLPYHPPSGSSSSALSRPGVPQLSLNPCSWIPDICYVEYTNSGVYNAVTSALSGTTVDPKGPLSKVPTSVLAVTLMISDTSKDPWSPLALSNLPNSDYANMAVVDAAMCSSAAPLYFPPYAVPQPSGTGTMWCADGGVVANNPSAFTLANVLESQVLQQEQKDLSNVRMLSLGTGATVDYIPSNLLDNLENDWGMLNWLFPFSVPPEPKFPLQAAMFDGQSQTADFITGNILGAKQYQRANPTLTGTINLDDCSQIGTLETVAQDYIQSSDWINAKQWAYDNFV